MLVRSGSIASGMSQYLVRRITESPDITLHGAYGDPASRAPFLLETILPGVFAVGDVRSGNIKRVASAVGEGSIAVAFVHQLRQC